MQPRYWLGLVATAVSAALIAPAVVDAATPLYRWIDADGRIVYSDQPPPDRKVERTLRRAPPPDPAASRRLADLENELRESKERTEECARLRSDLDLLRSDAQVHRVDEKGQRQQLDAAARKQAVDETAAQLADRCK